MNWAKLRKINKKIITGTLRELKNWENFEENTRYWEKNRGEMKLNQLRLSNKRKIFGKSTKLSNILNNKLKNYCQNLEWVK